MVIYIVLIFRFFLYIDVFASPYTSLENIMKGIEQDIVKKGT